MKILVECESVSSFLRDECYRVYSVCESAPASWTTQARLSIVIARA